MSLGKETSKKLCIFKREAYKILLNKVFSMAKYRFSVVAYLPKDVEKEAKRITKILSTKFSTSASAKLWDPHTTVGSGITVEETKLKQLFNDLDKFAKKKRKIKAKINGIDFFTNLKPPFKSPYAIFMKVNLNSGLAELHKALETNILEKYPKWYRVDKYRPHVTIAFNDLTKENFTEAKKFLKQINYNPKAVAKVIKKLNATYAKQSASHFEVF